MPREVRYFTERREGMPGRAGNDGTRDERFPVMPGLIGHHFSVDFPRIHWICSHP